MIAPPRTGWQTLVADLSIILFMVTAGALARGAPAAAQRRTPAPPKIAPVAAVPAEARPLSVYIAGKGGPTLAEWLAGQAIDPREQLTVVVRYRPSDRAQVSAQVAALFAAIAPAHVRTRIVVEPGDGPMTAGLAFDAAA